LEGDALSIGVFGIVNDSASLQTVNLNLTLGANQSFNAASGNLAIGGSVALGANTLTVTGGEDSTISGAISGDGGLVKTGAGNLTLGGANNFTGGTLVSAGALIGSTTSLQGGITNNASVTFNQSTNGTYSGAMIGTGSLVKTGSGNVTLSGANTFEGGTTISGGTLTGSTSSMPGDVAVESGATFAISQTTSGTFSGAITGAGRFVKDGSGDVTLSGANTYSGGTLVSAGTLTGTVSSLQGNITNNAAVVFVQTPDGTYSGAMSGSGSLTKSGTGTLTLSGANSYSGGTVVSGGTLAGTTGSLQGNINNSGTVRFDQATTGTYGGQLSGSGALVKAGSGAVTLEGNNTYGGATTVEGGSLIAANNNSLSSSAVTMSDGSVLAEAGVTLANNFTIGTAGSTTLGDTVWVAGWDFQTTDNGGTAIAAAPNTPTTIFANYGDQAGSAAIYLNGTAGSSVWVTATTGNELTSFGGTAINTTNSAIPGPNNVMDTATTAALSLVNSSANGKHIVFQVDMSSKTDLTLSYATRWSGTTAFTDQIWSYSTDGATWTGFYTNSTLTTSFALKDAGVSLAALSNAPTAYLRLTLDGATGSTANNRIDNVLLNATELDITPGTGTGTLGISEAGSATFSGSVAVNNTATFTAANGGLATFSGVVSGPGTAGISKTGAGTVKLSGASANTFTGMTTVAAGTLELAKSEDVTALAGAVTVNTGATLLLSSSGNVANTAAVTLSGGTITRASGVSEVFGNLNLTGASSLDFGLGDIGTLSFGTYTASALLTVQNFLPGNKLQFATGFNSALLPTGGELSNANFSFSNGFTTGTEGDYFTITAIPEPSTYAAAAGLLAMMLWPARRRLLKDVKSVLGLRAPMRDRLARSRL